MKHLLLFLIAATICSYTGIDCYAQTASECYHKGNKAFNSKDYYKAIEYFTKAIEKNYDSVASAYNHRGVAKYRLEQYEAAIRDYNKAIELNKNEPTIYNNRGLAEYDFGQYEEAIQDFDTVILLDANHATAYNNRGLAKDKLGQYKEAIQDFDKAIRLNASYTTAYNKRGLAKEKLGEYGAAIKDYNKAIQLDNSNYDAYSNRGYYYLKIGNYRAAITDWEKMQTTAPASYKPNSNYIAEARQKLRGHSQQMISKPIVNWQYPATAYFKTSTSIHNLKACIESSSPVTEVVLYINQTPYSTRDFSIEKVNNSTCDYEYKQRIEITSFNKPIYLTLEVSNSMGKVTSERVIEVEIESIVKPEPVVPNMQEKRLALVIGNSNYGDGASLKNPRNDAMDMKNTLQDLGFVVQLHYNLSEDGFKQAISRFGRDLKSYDVGLFFYAGHGIQYEGKNYLVPTDAILEYETNIEYECVDIRRVLSNMEGAASDINIVMLDACRNNPFERRWRRSTKGRGLAPTTAPKGTIIIYSADAGQVAADNPSDRNGLFTGELLKHITTKGLSIEGVLKRTGQSVFEKSGKQQMPASYSKFWGDFYFKR